MKTLKFKYTKEKDGDLEKTLREALLLNDHEKYVNTLDFGYLTEQEKTEALAIQADYEAKLKPFMDKAFRRFSKDKMEVLKE